MQSNESLDFSYCSYTLVANNLRFLSVYWKHLLYKVYGSTGASYRIGLKDGGRGIWLLQFAKLNTSIFIKLSLKL
jgi:hypothetical protein